MQETTVRVQTWHRNCINHQLTCHGFNIGRKATAKNLESCSFEPRHYEHSFQLELLRPHFSMQAILLPFCNTLFTPRYMQVEDTRNHVICSIALYCSAIPFFSSWWLNLWFLAFTLPLFCSWFGTNVSRISCTTFQKALWTSVQLARTCRPY